MKQNLLFGIMCLVGFFCLLYPTVSDCWNSFQQSKAVVAYKEKVTELDDADYERLLGAARNYNEKLYEMGNPHRLSDEVLREYESLLNISGDGIMGYVEIPAIDCSLPIYHGVDETVLQVAVGHVEWTSLPVGGENVHTVLSGHCGLPSARLFTDLEEMSVGDEFHVYVFDETLTYQVEEILVVEPREIEQLEIIDGKDVCTLVTCTPYGVNSHRLLVRGIRVPSMAAAENTDSIRISADAEQIEGITILFFLASPLCVTLYIWKKRNRRRKKGKRRRRKYRSHSYYKRRRKKRRKLSESDSKIRRSLL